MKVSRSGGSIETTLSHRHISTFDDARDALSECEKGRSRILLHKFASEIHLLER